MVRARGLVPAAGGGSAGGCAAATGGLPPSRKGEGMMISGPMYAVARRGSAWFLALAVAACGGGGGSSPAPALPLDDADAVSEALLDKVTVGAVSAQLLPGDPPAASADPDRPVIVSEAAPVAQPGQTVSLDLQLTSSSAIDRLFAKVPGAESFFEAVFEEPLGKGASGKLDIAVIFAVSIPLEIRQSGQLCFDLSARNLNGRVSSPLRICIPINVPGASPQPSPTATATPTASPQPTSTPTASPTATPTATPTMTPGPSPTPTPTASATPTPSPSPTPTPSPGVTTVAFAEAAQTAVEPAGVVNVGLTVNPVSSEDISLPFTVSGTATAGDRTVTASPLVIPAGTSNATISVSLIDDDGAEGDETVIITLSAPSGGAQLGSPSVHTLTIDDDEGDPAPQGTIFVIDDTYRLIRFNAGSPGTATFLDIQGIEATLPDNSSPLILSMDFRPATSELYVYTSDRRFYRLDTATATATLIASTPVTVTTDELLGLDFNPCADVLRAIGAEGENYRLTPSIALIARDTDLAYAAGDPNESAGTPGVNAIGYDDCSQGVTTLFGIDTTFDALVRVGSVDGTPVSPNTGQLNTVGELSFSLGGAGQVPLDIDRQNGAAYTTDQSGSQTSLLRVNLATGALTNLGQIGNGSSDVRVQALAVQP